MYRSLARPKLEFISAVDSNDTLYGGDSKFLAEINKLSETLVSQILDHLKTLGKEEVCSYSAWFYTKPIKSHFKLKKQTTFDQDLVFLKASGTW